MKYTDYKSIKEFLHENKDRVYHFWVYKRMFTPYEQDKKFTDESVYEDDHAMLGYIRESILLPDGDLLLGINEIYPGDGCSENLQFYKLSELRIAYNADDSSEDREGGAVDNEQ